jgi:uncharacterized protein (TIGR03437 family)
LEFYLEIHSRPKAQNVYAAGSMTAPRVNHTATLFPNGKVLIAGGTSTVELFDPSTGTFTATGAMTASNSSPLAVVNSPIDVTVNGKPAEVLAAAGYPGAIDGYQVNFRVPPDTGPGTAIIQISAAWIPGAPVSIQVK